MLAWSAPPYCPRFAALAHTSTHLGTILGVTRTFFGRSEPDYPPLALRERWSRSIPGHAGHAVACGDDAAYVSFGWGVAYPSLGVRRLSLADGSTTAELRTRSQQASGFVSSHDVEYIATDHRVLEVTSLDLQVRRQWDQRIRSFSSRLLLSADRVIMANWLAPSVGVLSLETGKSRAIGVGHQIQLLRADYGILAGSGQKGGFAVLDPSTGRTVPHFASPRYVSATTDPAGQELWLATGSRLINKGGQPPVSVLEPTSTLVRLTSGREDGRADAGGPCVRVWRDDIRETLWCAVRRPVGRRQATALAAVSLGTANPRGSWPAEPLEHFIELCPEHGVAYSTRRPDFKAATAVLTCYELPGPSIGDH
jgi:hypothetical protein